jgi:hypothetical protein
LFHLVFDDFATTATIMLGTDEFFVVLDVTYFDPSSPENNILRNGNKLLFN